MAKLNAPLCGDFKHLQRQLRFAAKLPLVLRYRGFLAARLIVAPSLWQIQPSIDQSGQFSPAQGREDAHLTIVHLTQATVPLPSNTGRRLAFLGEAAFIENQYRIATAQQIVRFQGDLPTEPFPIHAAFGQHMLHGLMIHCIHFAHEAA